MSTVVTTLLLVVAVGVIGSFLVFWANSTFGSQQLSVANMTANRINLVKESFVVEDVWFYTSGVKKANVTIHNSADLPITITKVYVNNTVKWSGSQVINPDATKTIPVTVTWGSGKPQTIMVETSRGSQAKQLWKS